MASTEQGKKELLARLLIEAQISPAQKSTGLDADSASDRLEMEPQDTALLLEEMYAQGFVSIESEQIQGRGNVRRYHITWEGWRERERLLRAQGRRFPALMNARDYLLEDLLIALLISGHIENQKPDIDWLCETPKLLIELCIYLPDYSEMEILGACKRLCDQRLLQEAQLFDSPKEKAFDCTERSRRAYDLSIARSLGLRPNQSILDLRSNPLLIDLPSPPWHQPAMQNLENALVKAYSTVQVTKILAQSAGINIERWNEQQAPRYAWHDLLELAMAQELLRELLEKALCDSSVSAHHAGLRKFLDQRVPESESPK